MKDWRDELQGLDIDAIWELGNQWVRLGDTLYEKKRALAHKVQSFGTHWTGDAETLMEDCWHDGLSPHWTSAIDTAWKIGEAINNFADRIKKQAEEQAKADNADLLTQVFGLVLNIVTLGAGALIGAALRVAGQLVSALRNVGRTLQQVLSHAVRSTVPAVGNAVSAAARSLGPVPFRVAGGAAFGGAAALGFDEAVGRAGAAAAGTDYHEDWGAEGGNIALGAVLGGGLAGAAGAGKAGGRGPNHPGVRGIPASSALGEVLDMGRGPGNSFTGGAARPTPFTPAPGSRTGSGAGVHAEPALPGGNGLHLGPFSSGGRGGAPVSRGRPADEPPPGTPPAHETPPTRRTPNPPAPNTGTQRPGSRTPPAHEAPGGPASGAGRAGEGQVRSRSQGRGADPETSRPAETSRPPETSGHPEGKQPPSTSSDPVAEPPGRSVGRGAGEEGARQDGAPRSHPAQSEQRGQGEPASGPPAPPPVRRPAGPTVEEAPEEHVAPHGSGEPHGPAHRTGSEDGAAPHPARDGPVQGVGGERPAGPHAGTRPKARPDFLDVVGKNRALDARWSEKEAESGRWLDARLRQEEVRELHRRELLGALRDAHERLPADSLAGSPYRSPEPHPEAKAVGAGLSGDQVGMAADAVRHARAEAVAGGTSLEEALPGALRIAFGHREPQVPFHRLTERLLAPPEGFRPEGWAREAGITDRATVHEVRDAWNEAHRRHAVDGRGGGPVGAFREEQPGGRRGAAVPADAFHARLAGELESRLPENAPVSAPGLADHMMRRQLGLERGDHRSPFERAREDADAIVEADRRDVESGKLGTAEADARRQHVLDAAPDTLRTHQAVHLAQRRAGSAFEQHTRGGAHGLDRRSLADVEADLTRDIASDLLALGRAGGLTAVREPVAPLPGEGPARPSPTEEDWHRFTQRSHDLVEHHLGRLGDRLRLERDAAHGFADVLRHHRVEERSAFTRDKRDALWEEYRRQFHDRTRTLAGEGARPAFHPRTASREDWDGGGRDRYQQVVARHERDWNARIRYEAGAADAERRMALEAGDAADIASGLSARPHPSRLRDADPRKVAELFARRRDRRVEALSKGSSPGELSAAGLDFVDRRARAGDLAEYPPALVDLHVGLEEMKLRAHRRIDEAVRADPRGPYRREHPAVEQLHTAVDTHLAPAYERAVDTPGSGRMWTRDELDAREGRFDRDVYEPFMSSLTQRLDYGRALESALSDAGGRFTGHTTGVDPVHGGAVRTHAIGNLARHKVGAEYRDRIAAAFHEHYGPGTWNLKGFLAAEKETGDAFGHAADSAAKHVEDTAHRHRASRARSDQAARDERNGPARPDPAVPHRPADSFVRVRLFLRDEFRRDEHGAPGPRGVRGYDYPATLHNAPRSAGVGHPEPAARPTRSAPVADAGRRTGAPPGHDGTGEGGTGRPATGAARSDRFAGEGRRLGGVQQDPHHTARPHTRQPESAAEGKIQRPGRPEPARGGYGYERPATLDDVAPEGTPHGETQARHGTGGSSGALRSGAGGGTGTHVESPPANERPASPRSAPARAGGEAGPASPRPAADPEAPAPAPAAPRPRPRAARFDLDAARARLADAAAPPERVEASIRWAQEAVWQRIHDLAPEENAWGVVPRVEEVVELVAAEHLRGGHLPGTSLLRSLVRGPARQPGPYAATGDGAPGGDGGGDGGGSPTEPVATFGTRRNGTPDLAHITPVPDHVVEWLREKAIAAAEDGGREDAGFRDAVRRTLTADLLSAEWPRLFGNAGLPLNVRYGRQRYPVSLRLSLSLIGPAPEQMSPMPDGPPVGLQQWAFGIHEDGDTAGAGDLRTGRFTYTQPWAVDRGLLSSVTFAPQVDLTWNQLTTTVTAGRTVQPMVLLRSKGRSLPYDYAMTWQVRRNTGTTRDVLADAGQPDWQDAGATPPAPGAPHGPSPLTVWFPTYLARHPEPQDEQEAGERPESTPAPLDRLLDELPLAGPESLLDHDTLFADVAGAFPRELGSLSERSADELFEFLEEGNLRSNLPQAWGGSVASPTLYSARGTALGYLRFTASLSGGRHVTGPATASSVLESYVLRSIRMQGTAQIANGLGVTLPVRFGLSPGRPDPVTGAGPPGGSISGQLGASHRFAHTLTSAGSARIARSLRTAEPLLHVTPDVTLTVALVRPDGAPVHPSDGSPLGRSGGSSRPLALRVPSVHTLGETPHKPRYLPREVLHLKQLGVSTTALHVGGTDPLFDRTERWLRDEGYLPSDRPQPRPWDHATEQAMRVQRLNNQRKLDRMRSRLALRGALDEMIEGGDAITFELPTAHGTRRATVRLSAERRYTGASDDDGVSHERALPGVQTLNYVGSTTAGDEQFQRTPFAWNAGGGAFVTNPSGSSGAHGDQDLQELGARYTYERADSTAAGSSAGTGHEYYMLSPTANGTQVFSVPVTYTVRITDSHAEGIAPEPAAGTVRLAVPTDRTSGTPDTGPRPRAAVVRDPQDVDRRRLALPGAGHTYRQGVLRLPETALFERVPGSADLRRVVPEMLDGIDAEAARQEEAAWRARAPMPGAFPEDIDLEAQHQSRGAGPDRNATAPDERASDGSPAPDPDAPAPRGPMPDLLLRAGAWAGDQAAGAARWAWRTAFGEPATRAESAAREVFDTAFSPHHMAGHGLSVHRDSYVVESAGTPGTAAGTDYLVEVEGYLTDVELLPEGQPMDAERWLQSVDASAFTSGTSASHRVAFSAAGRYGSGGNAFTPSGGYTYQRSNDRSTTVNDTTNVFRVTVEDTASVYRFTAKAHLVVTVRRGRRNVVSGTFRPRPGLSVTKVVEPDQSLEFLLVDNDLQNHPELAALARQAGRTPLSANRADRFLPAPYVSSGGVLGYGAASEVHQAGGRRALTERVRTLVEQEAPGTTVPDEATYLPGVLTRLNEHGTSHGLRALVNAGPRGHTAFHFVHRSWLGPRLVEVALAARPAPTAALASLRGKLVTRSSGLDNVFGHSRGDGTALDVPGATRVARSAGNSHELSFSPAGRHGAHRFVPTAALARRASWQDAQLSSRELRAWQRSFGNTAEFRVPYAYVVTVRSWALDDALIGRIIAGAGGGLASLPTAAAGVLGLSAEAVSGLPAVPGRTSSEPADVFLRFNSSETAHESRALTEGPGLFSSDPRAEPLPPAPGDAVIDMEVPGPLRELLNGPGWIPSRPFEVYDFAGTDALGEALRTVDPSLRREVAPRTTRSAEGMFIRLASLAASGRLALLGPAATAPYLGNPGSSRAAVSLKLYAPRVEATSKDTAIDRIELSLDGFQTQAATVMDTAATFEYTGGSGRRGGARAPLAGERASAGQHATASSQRRRLLRFGTPMENDKGEGMEGHRVRAVAVLEVRGPRGTRWVTGDILLRTTEAPPSSSPPSSSPGGAAGEREAGAAGRTQEGTRGEPAERPRPTPAGAYVRDRPVARFGGGHRLLTAYQWSRLDAVGATPRDVLGDGDCFFRALAYAAGPHVRRRLGLGESDGPGDVVKKTRAAVAAELAEHPERYADGVDGGIDIDGTGAGSGAGASTTVAGLAADIRTRGNYANPAGDVTPRIAAEVFGLRLTLVAETHDVSMGPGDGVPVTLVRAADGPLHFLAAVPHPLSVLPGPSRPRLRGTEPAPWERERQDPAVVTFFGADPRPAEGGSRAAGRGPGTRRAEADRSP